MKKEITRKRFIAGLIAGILSIALLLGMEAIERKAPVPEIEEPAAQSAETPAPAEPASASVSADTEGEFQPGDYTGTANGFGGPVDVTLTVGEAGGITNVEIKGDGETPDVGGAAIPTLAAALLEAQSAEIDAVSGATFTSQAVKDAAAQAIALASGQEVMAAPKPEGDNLFIPGTYTGSSKGFGGDVDVTVTVSGKSIDSIQIDGSHETENIGTFAVDMLDDRILAAQSPNVDALTGATVTSNAVFRALNDALVLAGADLSKFPKVSEADGGEKTYEELEADIVIVGAGGAGMTAAINATQAGKKVIVLEKMPYAGGNTTKATGGMNAAETHYQKEQGIEDSVAQFVEDTMKGGHEINDKDLVTVMAKNSAKAIDWLDSIGAPLPKVSFSGGATNKRIHAPEDGSGVGGAVGSGVLFPEPHPDREARRRTHIVKIRIRFIRFMASILLLRELFRCEPYSDGQPGNPGDPGVRSVLFNHMVFSASSREKGS